MGHTLSFSGLLCPPPPPPTLSSVRTKPQRQSLEKQITKKKRSKIKSYIVYVCSCNDQQKRIPWAYQLLSPTTGLLLYFTHTQAGTLYRLSFCLARPILGTSPRPLPVVPSSPSLLLAGIPAELPTDCDTSDEAKRSSGACHDERQPVHFFCQAPPLPGDSEGHPRKGQRRVHFSTGPTAAITIIAQGRRRGAATSRGGSAKNVEP